MAPSSTKIGIKCDCPYKTATCKGHDAEVSFVTGALTSNLQSTIKHLTTSVNPFSIARNLNY